MPKSAQYENKFSQVGRKLSQPKKHLFHPPPPTSRGLGFIPVRARALEPTNMGAPLPLTPWEGSSVDSQVFDFQRGGPVLEA